MSARLLVQHLAVVALCAGCGLWPSATTNPDGGILIVPRSYHQAMQTGGHVVHVGAAAPDGGTIACRACHDVDVKGFEAPGLDGCRSCHPANAGFHHGADAGLPDGGQVSCLSCHPFWVREGERPLTNWVCLDCHAQPVGAKRAVRVHDTACFFCHQPHRDPFTQPPDCTVCHDRIGLAHGAKGPTVAKTCMTCHEQHAAAAEATKACVACHSNPREQRRPATLVTTKALLDEGHTSCGSCHLPHRFAKAEVKPCETCHTNHPVLAKGVTPKAHVACIGCHAPHSPKSPPKTCESCHAQVASTHPVKPELAACMSCHPMHEALPPGTVAKDCGSCHSASEFTGTVHAERADGGAPLTCVSCHAPHDFAVQRGSQAPCKRCHQQKVTAVTKVKNSGHATCADCHAGLPHKPSDTPKACTDCHADKPSTGAGHVRCLDCHEPHSGTASTSCRTCHAVSTLEGLHAEAKHQTCTDCHGPHAPKPGFQRDGCRACHKDKASHQPKAERCTGCHLFREPTSAPGGPP